MDIQTLINTLTAGGFQLSARDDDKLAILGPVAKLTPEQTQAIRSHKPQLLAIASPQLPPACIPYEQAEREAIRWADTPAADEALEFALADWDELEPWPPACETCGFSLFRWDANGNRHCVRCSPGQSERVAMLAAKLRKQPKRKKAKPSKQRAGSIYVLLQQPLEEKQARS